MLRERIKEGKRFESFASNIYDVATNDVMKGCIRKKVLKFDDFKVGLFGVCTQATESLSRPGDSVKFCQLLKLLKHLLTNYAKRTVVT